MVFMGLFPPWKRTIETETTHQSYRTDGGLDIITTYKDEIIPAGYAWIGGPPHSWRAPVIDLTRLGIQWFVVLVMVVAWVATTNNRASEGVDVQPHGRKRWLDHCLDALHVALAVGLIGFAIFLAYEAWMERETREHLFGALISATLGLSLMWSFWRSS